MASNICQQCNKPLSETDNFCSNCGNQLSPERIAEIKSCTDNLTSSSNQLIQLFFLVLSWMSGMLFLLLGIFEIPYTFLGGLCLVIISLLLLPFIRNFIFSKVNKKIPVIVRIIIIFILIMIYGMFKEESDKRKYRQPVKASYKEIKIIEQNFSLLPDIKGVIVWAEGSFENSDIYGYDFEIRSKFPICTAPSAQSNPVISGNVVVWQDDRSGDWENSDIYGFNLESQRELIICSKAKEQSNPIINKKLITWIDFRDSKKKEFLLMEIYDTASLYCYNVEKKNEFVICSDLFSPKSPVINDKYIVWSDCRNQEGEIKITCPAIYGYNFDLKQEFYVPASHQPGVFPLFIVDDVIIWSEWEDDKLCAYDSTSGERYTISMNEGYFECLGIISDILFWRDFRHGSNSFNIYGYNLKTHERYFVFEN